MFNKQKLMLFLGTVLASLVFPQFSNATYSIIAVDKVTGEVGAAATTCSPDLGRSLFRGLYVSAPGHGVLVSQAWPDKLRSNPYLKNDCGVDVDYDENNVIDMMNKGKTAAEIRSYIEYPPEPLPKGLCDAVWEFSKTVKQIGILTINHNANDPQKSYATDDAILGEDPKVSSAVGSYKGGLEGSTERYDFRIQGNTLTGEKVLTSARDAFIAGGADLAERLMNALEAGNQVDPQTGKRMGDVRCGVNLGSAFIVVDKPNQKDISTSDLTDQSGRYLFLSIIPKDVPNTNYYVVGALRTEFNQWRAAHPLSAPAKITSPSSGSTINNTTITFIWTPTNPANNYVLTVGTGLGMGDVYGLVFSDTQTSTQVTNIPLTGNPIYVRLSSKVNGQWVYQDYVYSTIVSVIPAKMTTPAAGVTKITPTTLKTFTFGWSAGAPGATYSLSVGTKFRASDIFVVNAGSNLNVRAGNLPSSGTIYVTLSTINSTTGKLQWVTQDYRYTIGP